MLVIELEPVGAEERPRLERQGLEINRSAFDAIEALEHRGDFGRSHVRPELRHLLIGALALPDEIGAALEAADEAHAVEQRTVERPVLDVANVLEQERAMAVPWPRRSDRKAAVADVHPMDPDQRIVAEAIFAAAERRAGGE